MSLYLGCPVWACEKWVNTLLRSRNRKTWLHDYSAVFNTVEGNSTFYGLPGPETVRRWGESTHDGFRFALKFPRVISHERRLVGAEAETEQFVERLRILQDLDRLGPSFLQLPPGFSFREFSQLVRYVEAFPREFPLALEVRHADFFDDGPNEAELDAFLRERQIDKVLFDSRALFSRPPSDEIEESSQSRKPRSPYRTTVTGSRPMLRFVGRNQLGEVAPWIEEWGPVIAGWITSGLTPYIFTHSPDDAFAPEFARRMYAEICRHCPALPALPEPVAARSEKKPKQLNLFPSD